LTVQNLICFAHHKGASRLFRFQVFQPIAEHLGLEIVRYQRLQKSVVFNDIEELELKSIEFDLLERGDPKVILIGNSGPRITRAIRTANPNFRAIHAVRDPRQILVSGYFHHLDGHDIIWPGFYWEKLAIDREMLKTLNEEDGILYELENISDQVLSQILVWQPDQRILEVRMEDLIDSPNTVMADICVFLGISSPPSTNMDNESKNEASQSWQSVFTPRIKKRFKEKFNEIVMRYGYETDPEW
jgi:Sulfotransferase domain